MTRDAFGRAPARLPEPLPIPADVPPGHLDLMLWVHIDALGEATYGGRLDAVRTAAALHWLADHVLAVWADQGDPAASS